MIVAYVTPELARVAVDTISYPGGHYYSKLNVLPAAHAVYVTRGSSFWADTFHRRASILPSFDALVREAPEMLAAAYDLESRNGMLPKGPGFGGGLEVLIVGSSSLRRNGFLSAVLARHDADGPSVEDPILCLLRPHPSGYAPRNDLLETDAVVEAARAQAAALRKAFPQYPCGGSLVLASLDRKTITVETLCRDL